MAKEKFPEAFKITGCETEFLYLLERKTKSNKKEYTVMKAKHDGIEKVENKPAKGSILPIYLLLLKTLYFVGTMEIS